MSNLTLFVGAPGAGKSSEFQRAFYTGAVCLSSDTLRGQIGKDESDQSVSGQVFATMEVMARYLLNQGFDVVIDATNMTKKARAPFVRIGRECGARVRAKVFDTSIEECKRRNAARARKVPEHVIDRMFAQFEMPTEAEGFENII